MVRVLGPVAVCMLTMTSHILMRSQRNVIYIYATNVAYDIDYDYPHEDTTHRVGTDMFRLTKLKYILRMITS
jgi:hypothetical protein